MKTVTATDIKNHWGDVLHDAIREPVLIEKNRRPVAVVLSVEEHTRLTRLEDRYWVLKAEEAEKEGYLEAGDSASFLKERLENTE